MLGAVTYIIREQATNPWILVLAPTVPAAIAAGAALWSSRRAGHAVDLGAANKQHLVAIDAAVNGVQDGHPTLREKVEAIDTAVNGTAAGDPSIRENVETLVDRRDLDPNRPPQPFER